MKEEKVVLKTEFITLNQLLKLVGVSANGAEAKYMILDGKVKVNGEVEIRRGKKIRVGDNIDVEIGRAHDANISYAVFCLKKKKNMISSSTSTFSHLMFIHHL